MRPMLAEDAILEKLRYPLVLMPKIDGVRGCHFTGSLTGRSLKPHGNKHVAKLFSHPSLAGCDGELAARKSTHSRLCNLTHSAVSTIEGEPKVKWWLFDYAPNPEIAAMGYLERLELLERIWDYHTDKSVNPGWESVRLVPYRIVKDQHELTEALRTYLEDGYEGVVVRDPHGPYKFGRSTVTEGGFLRIKPFVTAEMRIESMEEGVTNLNEAKRNKLGLIERSSHKANKKPNGMIGSLYGTLITDIKFLGKVVIPVGRRIKVSPGKLTKEERVRYFQDQSLILDRICTIKTFPLGVKDNPRFTTFQSFRSEADMS